MNLEQFQFKLEQEGFCLDEWADRTLGDFQVTDYIKCVVCKNERSPGDIHKRFQRHEGICKRCWNYSEEDA